MAEDGPSWRMVAVGACVLILSGGGYLIGDTLSSLRQELKDVRTILDQRSGLPTRVDTIERETHDQEQRLRAIEKQVWERYERR